MKKITVILTVLFICACNFAQAIFRVESNPGNHNTTSMLTSTFGWHFYFITFSETNSSAINYYELGLARVAMNQTKQWLMRKT